jgi:Protein of unknown function (DUF2934)
MSAHNKHARHSGHSQTPAADVVAFVAPDAIARRAYELFQERGHAPGHELDDGLRAEYELKQLKSRQSE